MERSPAPDASDGLLPSEKRLHSLVDVAPELKRTSPRESVELDPKELGPEEKSLLTTRQSVRISHHRSFSESDVNALQGEIQRTNKIGAAPNPEPVPSINSPELLAGNEEITIPVMQSLGTTTSLTTMELEASDGKDHQGYDEDDENGNNNDDEEDDDNLSDGKGSWLTSRCYLKCRFFFNRKFLTALSLLGIVLLVLGLYTEYTVDKVTIARSEILISWLLLSGLICDAAIELTKAFLSFLLRRNLKSGWREELSTGLVYLTGLGRSPFYALWSFLTLVGALVVMPTNRGEWEKARYHVTRVLTIIFMIAIAHVIIVVFRMRLTKDLNARTLRHRFKKTMLYEHVICTLNGGSWNGVFLKLFPFINRETTSEIDLRVLHELTQYLSTRDTEGSEVSKKDLRKIQQIGVEENLQLDPRIKAFSKALFNRVYELCESHRRMRLGLDTFELHRRRKKKGSSVVSNTYNNSLTVTSESSRSGDEKRGNVFNLNFWTQLGALKGKDNMQSLTDTASYEDEEVLMDAGEPSVGSAHSDVPPATTQRKQQQQQQQTVLRSLSDRPEDSNSVPSRSKTPPILPKRRAGSDDKAFRTTGLRQSSKSLQERSVSKRAILKSSSGRDRRQILKDDFFVVVRNTLESPILPNECKLDPEQVWTELFGNATANDKFVAASPGHFQRVIANMFADRRNISGTLADSRRVIRTIDYFTFSFALIIVGFISLALYEINFLEIWIALSSVLLGFTFVFGNTVAKAFENIVFLFVVHPFDVGDSLLLPTDGSRYRVKRINLYNTELVRWNGDLTRVDNAALSKMTPLVNLSTSESWGLEGGCLVDIECISKSFIDNVHNDIKAYVQSKPGTFTGITLLNARKIADPCKVNVTFYVEMISYYALDIVKSLNDQSDFHIVFVEALLRHGARFSRSFDRGYDAPYGPPVMPYPELIPTAPLGATSVHPPMQAQSALPNPNPNLRRRNPAQVQRFGGIISEESKYRDW